MNPPDARKILAVTKTEAAQAQLESAIWLWFMRDDAISVHTLAVAAHDCYAALTVNTGITPSLQTFMKSQSKGAQKRAIEAWNFFKHGHKKPRKKQRLNPMVNDMLILECCYIHRDLHKGITPLMHLFWARFLVEYPEAAPSVSEPFFKYVRAVGYEGLSRSEFFERMRPAIPD